MSRNPARVAFVARTAPAAKALSELPSARQLNSEYLPFLLVESGVQSLSGFQPGGISSVYWCAGSCMFDAVWLDLSFNLMDSPWARTFLRRLYGMVVPGGQFAVPKRFAKGASGKVDPEANWIAGYFRSVARIAEEEDHFIIERGAELPPGVPSVLEHFCERGTETLCTAVLNEVGRIESDSDRPLNEKEVLRQINALGYYIGGLSYKAPMLKLIAGSITPRRPLRVIDMGGGYGLLAAELLLDPDLGVEHSIVTDLSILNRALARLLQASLGKAGDSFEFVRVAAQEYTYPGRFDVIIFISSLLYVPRDRLRATLDRAWEALAPGGVLVVHENIKDPKYTRDFKVMFTVEELDAALGFHGEIERYSSTKPVAMTRDAAGQKSVFRVVRKLSS